MADPYYSDDHVTIYHGDCLEIDVWLEADVLVTDPPYGMALRSGWSGAFDDCAIIGDDDATARDDALALWGDRPALVCGRWSIERPKATRMLLTLSPTLCDMSTKRKTQRRRHADDTHGLVWANRRVQRPGPRVHLRAMPDAEFAKVESQVRAEARTRAGHPGFAKLASAVLAERQRRG